MPRKTLPNGDQINFDGIYYDYRAADGKRMIKLWVPPESKPVRGVFISGHGGGSGDSRDFARDLNFRAFAARVGFGTVGLHWFPGRDVYENGGKVFFSVLDEFAALGHHPELANVPFCIFGSSNGGATSYGFVNHAPKRTICFLANVCSRFNPAEPVDDALQVPGVVDVGMFDTFGKGEEGVARAREMMLGARRRGARWSLIVEQKGHEDGYAFDTYVKMCEQCIALRYPADGDPAKGPVLLRDLPLESGWLVDHESWDSGLTRIAPYAAYRGEKSVAGWVPSEDMAVLYRAVATHENPVALSIEGVDPIHNPHTNPQTMFSIGGPVVEPGRSLKLVCDLWELPEWRKVEFFAGSRKLGDVVAPAAPELTTTVEPASTVCSFTALATDAAGNTRASNPFYVSVRDPAIRIDASTPIADTPVFKDAVGTVGSRVSGTTPVSAPESLGPVLAVPGLSAAQEKTFGAKDNAVSAFWEQVAGELRLTAKENADEGSRFSIVTMADAVLRVKAAHTARGLYLYLEVTDNCFMECSPEFYYAVDAVDIMLDCHSSAHVSDSANDTQLICQGWGLGLATKQIHVAFGNRRPPPFFLRNYADPWDFTQHRCTFEEARTHLGIDIRFVTLSKMVRVQEWFLPWAEVGTGLITEEPPVGTRLAFAAGYNDTDADGSGEKRLRLMGPSSPWRHGAGTEAPRGWGDILIED